LFFADVGWKFMFEFFSLRPCAYVAYLRPFCPLSPFRPFLTLLIFVGALYTNSCGADKVVLVAGGKTNAENISATEAVLKEPFGTAFGPANDLWIIEMASGNRLLRIDQNGSLRHVAGQLKSGFSGDGGPANLAQFNGPHSLAIRPDGRILIADTWNGRIRQVDPKTGHVESLAGFDVPIEKAKGSGAYCATLDFSGNYLYVADLNRIHRLDLTTNIATIVAGNGKKGVPKDGSTAIESPLVDPRAVAVDRLGNMYILERGGNSLRVVKPDGTIRTVVNSSGKKGTALDAFSSKKKQNVKAVENQHPEAEPESAIEAMMNGPKHLCIDLLNRVIIADAENHLIRRYDPADGTLRRIAGTGESGHDGIDGPPLSCLLARPHGVTIHTETGELFITDSYNNRILKITSDPK